MEFFRPFLHSFGIDQNSEGFYKSFLHFIETNKKVESLFCGAIWKRRAAIKKIVRVYFFHISA